MLNNEIKKVTKEIKYSDKKSGTEITIEPSEQFEVDVTIDYNSETLGIQNATLNSITKFQDEISSSRTFCFLHELEVLLENKLIKGGDVNNAIVIVENEIT